MSVILTEKSDRILTVTINRPEKMNALNGEVVAGLAAALDLARNDDEIGVVIITGTGEKAFVAGADIGELASLDPIAGRNHARSGQAVLNHIEDLGKPVIAAINGFALGGGCELAMACTLRIAADNARLGQPEVSLGLIPGYGGTQRLPRLVGEGVAMDLCLTGRLVKAEEAARIGLVNRVVPAAELISTAREMAGQILKNGPVAVRLTMEAIHRGLQMTLAEGLALETNLFGLVATTADKKEGTAAFLEKRPANFTGS